jgi:NAD(P)-dependent dehydrogenase (short-subunit alcohol dehydrogenase family)
MILDRFRLDGQVALVTGASRGIGAATARALYEAGARVVLSSSSPMVALPDWARDTDMVRYIRADLTQAGTASRLVAEAADWAGRLDILVNNAGMARGGDTHVFAWDDYRAVMALNVDAVFEAAQTALGRMRDARSGAILNIGSISGFVANVPQKLAAYGAAKAAIHMLTKSLASEYAEDGIRVNCIAPGYIATEMTRSSLADHAIAETWIEMTPMKRIGSVEDIAAAALYLCSPAAGFVTGATLVVDGGYLCR